MIQLDYLKLASQILGDTGTQRKGRKGRVTWIDQVYVGGELKLNPEKWLMGTGY